MENLDIRILISESNIKHKDIAKKMGISEVSLNEVISGKRGLAFKYAKKLDEAFGVPALVWLTFANIKELEDTKCSET